MGRRRYRRLVFPLVIAVLYGAFAAPAQAAPKPGEVKVMTRNLYLGADLGRALDDTSSTELAIDAQIILNVVKQTDFPDRAKLLAAEIAKSKPDLVGLQEVALWRRDTIPNPDSPTGYPLADGPLTPATTVDYDFLHLLRHQLRRQGTKYRVVRSQREADIEVPAANGCPDEPDGPTCDGRLTMRDVILAREGAGVRTRFTDSGHYSHQLIFHNIANSGLDVNVNRGWLYADANVRGTRFRFVDTHLEAFDDGTIRQAQAQELTQPFPPSFPPGPATVQSAGMPVIAVGDFNSDDDTVSGNDQLAYNALIAGGLTELSTGPTAPDAASSCCMHSETLSDPPSTALAQLDHQVDHVFVSDGDATPISTHLVGNDPAEFDRFGIWPSDHAGLVTKIQFPAP